MAADNYVRDRNNIITLPKAILNNNIEKPWRILSVKK